METTSTSNAEEVSLEHTTGTRQSRLQHLLQDELQALLRSEASDPRLSGIRLLSVTLSIDGGQATLAYAVDGRLGDEQAIGRESQTALARAQGFLRLRLSQQLALKKTPKLKFTFVGIAEPAGDQW